MTGPRPSQPIRGSTAGNWGNRRRLLVVSDVYQPVAKGVTYFKGRTPATKGCWALQVDSNRQTSGIIDSGGSRHHRLSKIHFSSYDASDYTKSIKIYGYTVFDTLLIVLLSVKYLTSLLQATTVMHQQVLRSHRNSFSIFLNTTYWISRKIYEIEYFIFRILCPDLIFLYVKCCMNFRFTFNDRSINY